MKKVIVVTLLVLVGFSSSIFAQESIKAVIKKSEQKNSVEMTYIISSDPETRALQHNITTIKISNDPALVKEFIAAFEKDKDKAYSVSGTIKNGESIPSTYKFAVGKESYISCTMSISNNNADASVSYRESPNKPSNVSVFMNGMPFDMSGLMPETGALEHPLQFHITTPDSPQNGRLRGLNFNPESSDNVTYFKSDTISGNQVVTIMRNSSGAGSSSKKSVVTITGTGTSSSKKDSIED